MHRRRHRRKSKQGKIIMGSMIGLLAVFTVGYSAFQTTLNVNVKGNVKKLSAADVLKQNVVTTGDGLYKDTFTDGRYYYRGANPNNYITFNNETWRIISVESDGTLKIVRNERLAERIAWDTATSCDTIAYSTQKIKKATKKNKYIVYRKDYLIPPIGEFIGCNNWLRPATLNTYLNGTYYNSFLENEKEKIEKGIFYIGTPGQLNATESLSVAVAQEKKQKWEGYIALYTITEMLRASISTGCLSLSEGAKAGTVCANNNWLWPIKTAVGYEWTLSPSSVSDNFALSIGQTNTLVTNLSVGTSDPDIRPVLHLSKDITLKGDGTSSSPYSIN